MNLKKRKEHLLFLLIVFCSNLGFSQAPSLNALVLDGTNIVQVPDDPLFSLSANSQHTFEGWFNLCTPGQLINSNDCQSTQAGYYLDVVANGNLRFNGIFGNSCTSPSLLMTGGPSVLDDQWHHFILKVNSTATTTTAWVYLDGSLILTNTGNGIINDPPTGISLKFGTYRTIAGNYTFLPEGRIDEFRIYDADVPLADLGLVTPLTTVSPNYAFYAFEPPVSSNIANSGNAAGNGTNFNVDPGMPTAPWVTNALYQDSTINGCCPAATDPLFVHITGPITTDMFWDGKIYIPDNTIVSVTNDAILDITTADVVFGECSGIDFSDGAMLRANNSVFRPCAMDGTWRGVTFQSTSGDDHQVNENTFKNAEIALSFDRRDASINSNSFINCNEGIYAVNATFDQAIFGNNFVTNNMLPDFDQCVPTTNSDNLFGIKSIGTDFFSSISENQFLRSNSNSARLFTGIENMGGGATISENKFSNATNAIVISSPKSAVTIENNEIELNDDYNINGVLTAQVSLLNIAGPIVRVKTNEIFNISQADPSQRYGIYANASSNVSIENNIIDGFSDAIAGFLSGSFNISENVITNASTVGIYLEESLDAHGNNFLTCNDVTMKVGSGSGIWTVNTTEGTEISSNCIKDSDKALRTHGSPLLAMPFIRNNYLYNYQIGIENLQYSGAIGTISSPGLNTLWSNNNGAVDIFSDVTITAADNFGMFNISMFLVGITSNNPYHSTASCGHQIFNMPSQGNFNTDYNCDHWTSVISPLQKQGEKFKVLNTSEALALIESTENSFPLLLRILLSEEWSDELMNEFITKAKLNDHETHLAKMYFYKAFGRFDEALIELNQLDPEMMVANYDLAENMAIQLLNGQAISSNEVVSVSDLSSDLGVTSDLFASVSHFSPVHYQYNLKTIEPVDIELNESSILRIPKGSVEMVAYPNPFEDLVTIRIVNGNDFENQELNIYDLTGVLIKNHPIELMSGEVTVDLSGFAAGTYFVSLNTSPENKVKIVKLK
jgi:hypothetical protein